ncbi:ribonuclease HII [Pollutimonas harenae]|uniref:Ribonuclease HII n=1 Tax=Pollutimonas harenae TaxID=657015 RepID=A0A853H6B9_9BURK|nr:ribonuclease HII [Pollutimonas harenae]NYT86063.1 ribonuclease HII [Pollutimonas harenae]TEA71110.1 ribonuclease HII [Pollutimonas harenae]
MNPQVDGQFDLFDAGPVVLNVAGIDEAGRGPLAGPVFAAAVILDPARPIKGLDDSKKLSAARREALALAVREHALAWCIASASVEEIDTLNILQATMLAMRRACEGLTLQPSQALIDGNRVPQGLSCTAQAIVGGDASVAAISAASILAKTARDADCLLLHQAYPDYCFDQHKGYGTALHLARLHTHGPCPAHRRSFAPVRKLLQLNATSAAAGTSTPAQ